MDIAQEKGASPRLTSLHLVDHGFSSHKGPLEMHWPCVTDGLLRTSPLFVPVEPPSLWSMLCHVREQISYNEVHDTVEGRSKSKYET